MHSPSSEQHYTKKLSEQGYRLTPQRLAILRALLVSSNRHPSAQDIFQLLRGDFPTLSLTTVYNTLALFVEANIAREIKMADGGVRFDVNTEPHINLYCRHCHTIIDMPYEQLYDLQQAVYRLEGFTINEPIVELAGICKNCRSEGSKEY